MFDRWWRFVRPGRESDAPGAPMVEWYSPTQLLRTGIDVMLSLAFAKRADYRLIEALGIQQTVFAYDDEETIWIDYAADVGDGFNPTYEIARQLAKPELAIAGSKQILPRGRVLILGGDQVYPTPTEEAYRERLIAPYESACKGREGSADVFALPGNHDWYDGLVAFMGTFCTKRPLGLWRTKQARSYFALKLPHRWWLLGVDTQLGSDIDTPQIEYFKGLDLRPGDRAILCTAEPHWVYGNIYDKEHHKQLATLIDELEQREVEVPLQLAGDLHHYRRFQQTNGRAHLITAGGGGAFLHPTHANDRKRIQVGANEQLEFARATQYPSNERSWWLGFLTLAFPTRNWSFGLVTAIGYMALSWIMPPPNVHAILALDPIHTLTSALHGIADSGLGLAWVATVVAGFVLFTDTHKRMYRLLGGGLHGAIHLAGALVISAMSIVASQAASKLWVTHVTAAYREDLVPFIEKMITSFGIFALGLIFGPMIMGFYLFVSITIFGRHSNEAFSALRIEGYRNFLRMKIDRSGLALYALGLDDVPHRWELRGERWEPAPPCRDETPRLIDEISIASGAEVRDAAPNATPTDGRA